MKKSISGIVAVLLLAGIFSCKKENSEPPEALVFSDTIYWEWEKDQIYGGNSFFWWHYLKMGVVNLGELPDNWKKPNDFENGTFHMRIEILEQPTDSSFKLQLGFWQDKEKEGGHSETISSHVAFRGGAGELIEADLGSPSDWWELRPDAPVDFTRPVDFYQIGLALWRTDPWCIPMGQGWNNSNSCDNPEQAAAEFFPLKARVTVVAIAEGYSFTGWDNYP